MIYSSDVNNKPSARVPLFKQWEIVPNGIYLVTRIFRPNKYPSATLTTTSFRVSIPEDEWATMRGDLFEAIQAGKQLAISHKRGAWELIVVDFFKNVVYLRDEYGVHHTYQNAEDCYRPFESPVAESSTLTQLDDNPL